MVFIVGIGNVTEGDGGVRQLFITFSSLHVNTVAPPMGPKASMCPPLIKLTFLPPRVQGHMGREGAQYGPNVEPQMGWNMGSICDPALCTCIPRCTQPEVLGKTVPSRSYIDVKQ